MNTHLNFPYFIYLFIYFSLLSPFCILLLVHDVIMKMLLTGMLIYVPSTSRAGIATLVCMLAIANVNFFQPHKNKVSAVAKSNKFNGSFLCVCFLFFCFLPNYICEEVLIFWIYIFEFLFLIFLCYRYYFG